MTVMTVITVTYVRLFVSIERLLHTFPHPAVLVMVKKVPMAANIC